VPVNGRKAAIPRESVYETELTRIRIFVWSVTQLTTYGDNRRWMTQVFRTKRDYEPIVLELLATGEESFIKDTLI